MASRSSSSARRIWATPRATTSRAGATGGLTRGRIGERPIACRFSCQERPGGATFPSDRLPTFDRLPLTLVTGPANAAKAGSVLGGFRSRLDEEPLLVVPR